MPQRQRRGSEAAFAHAQHNWPILISDAAVREKVFALHVALLVRQRFAACSRLFCNKRIRRSAARVFAHHRQ